MEAASGAPEAVKTIAALNQHLSDLDKLLADPDIQKTIAHGEGTVETVDIVTEPLRKKASLLRKILSIVGGMIKLNLPLF
jgi:hypothetical protein